MIDNVEGFEREYQALALQHEDDVKAVKRNASALNMSADEQERALKILTDDFETAWLLLRVEWGLE